MQQQQKQPVKKLAKYALNQLMADTELSEVYFNLDLYEKLTTDEAEQKFLRHLSKAAAAYLAHIYFANTQPQRDS